MQVAHYRIQRSSLQYRWVSVGIVAALPLPGSKAFEDLSKALGSFGAEARQVVVETGAARLSDRAISFALWGGAIRLLMRHTGFEVLIDHLLDEHINVIHPVADLACGALTSVDPPEGTWGLCYSAHLTLIDQKPRDFLRSFAGPVSSGSWDGEPDGVAFVVGSPHRPGLQQARVTLAQSLLSPDAVFVELNLEYTGGRQPSEISREAVSDVLPMLGMFGLQNASEVTK